MYGTGGQVNRMSDDLISRKALLKKLEVFNDRDHGNEHFLLGIESAKEIIKNEPAAFDKKKVIEKLKRLEVNAFGYYNQYDDEQAFGESAAYRAAIEIIEKGGIE